MRKYLTPIIVVVTLLAAFIWWWMSSGGSGVPISQSGTSGPTLELVERLKNIKINTSFFNDQEFLNLEASPKTSLEGLQKGRSNPFTPGRR